MQPFGIASANPLGLAVDHAWLVKMNVTKPVLPQRSAALHQGQKYHRQTGRNGRALERIPASQRHSFGTDGMPKVAIELSQGRYSHMRS
jgi:hypothetical protein